MCTGFPGLASRPRDLIIDHPIPSGKRQSVSSSGGALNTLGCSLRQRVINACPFVNIHRLPMVKDVGKGQHVIRRARVDFR